MLICLPRVLGVSPVYAGDRWRGVGVCVQDRARRAGSMYVIPPTTFLQLPAAATMVLQYVCVAMLVGKLLCAGYLPGRDDVGERVSGTLGITAIVPQDRHYYPRCSDGLRM